MNWKKNRLAIAAGVLVVATVGAILASRSRSADNVAPEPTPSLPSFEPDAVDALVVSRPDDDDLRFEKVDGTWQMKEPVEARADESAVSQAVEKLAELEVKGVASDNPALHERLEVVEGKAVRASVEKAGETLLDVWIGPRKDAGTLVRVEGEDAVLTIGGSIRYPFTKGTHMYRDREITDLEPDTVRAVRLQTEEATFAFERELPEGEWTPVEGTPAIEEYDPGRVESLVSSLVRMRAAGFDAPGTTAEELGLAPPQATVELELAPQEEGGEPRTVELQLGKLHEDDKEYSLRRADSDVPFRVSKLAGERLIPEAEKFAKKDEPQRPQMPANPHPAPGQQQLPPGVMKQLQQQMQQRQMGQR